MTAMLARASEIALHPLHRLGRQRLAKKAVKPSHRRSPVARHLVVRQVKGRDLGMPPPRGVLGSLALERAGEPFGPDRFAIYGITVDPALLEHQAGARRHDLDRIAAEVDHAGVGKSVEQRVGHVAISRAFQHPALARLLAPRPAIQPQQGRQLRHHRRPVAPPLGGDQAGHVPLHRRLRAGHGKGEVPEFLVRQHRTRGMDLLHRRVERAQQAVDRRRLPLPPEVSASIGYRKQAFVQPRPAEARIACKQALHAGRTRTHRPHDDDRPFERTVGDLRMTRQQPLRPHPCSQQPDQLPVGDDPAERIEFGISLQLFGQQREPRAPMLAANTGRAASLQYERLDLIRIERHRRHFRECAVGDVKKGKRRDQDVRATNLARALFRRREDPSCARAPRHSRRATRRCAPPGGTGR